MRKRDQKYILNLREREAGSKKIVKNSNEYY